MAETLDEQQLVGLLGDVAELVLADLESLVDEMDDSIAGSPPRSPRTRRLRSRCRRATAPTSAAC